MAVSVKGTGQEQEPSDARINAARGKLIIDEGLGRSSPSAVRKLAAHPTRGERKALAS